LNYCLGLALGEQKSINFEARETTAERSIHPGIASGLMSSAALPQAVSSSRSASAFAAPISVLAVASQTRRAASGPTTGLA
jgi:hypothetical protein